MALMQNKKKYSFQVYTPQILGNGFRNVEILGHFPYETAIALNGEIAPVHAEIYSTGNLPVGTPNDPRQYDYYRIRMQDGSITMIGEVWIDQSSIVEVSATTCTITIPNVSTADTPRLRTMLAQAGYKDFEINFDGVQQLG